MTNEEQIRELSEEYKAWLGKDGDCGFLPAMKEVERLCDIIVGLRARVVELEGAREELRQQRDTAGKLTIVASAMDGLNEMECDCGHDEPCSRCIAIAAIEAQAAELERLRHIVEGLREVCGGEFVKHLEMRKFDRSPAQAEPQDESKIIGGHHENCDVFQPAPDGGPSQKPCNCRPFLESERQSPLLRVGDPWNWGEVASR